MLVYFTKTGCYWIAGDNVNQMLHYNNVRVVLVTDQTKEELVDRVPAEVMANSLQMPSLQEA